MSGQVETMTVDWLVDTGCSITILSSHVFFKIHPDDRPELCGPNRDLVSADSSPLKVSGEAKFNITVGQKTVSHLTVVADISNDGLLGMHFPKQHEFSIDFRTNILHSQDKSIATQCKLGQCRSCLVTMAEHTIIPAGTLTLFLHLGQVI